MFFLHEQVTPTDPNPNHSTSEIEGIQRVGRDQIEHEIGEGGAAERARTCRKNQIARKTKAEPQEVEVDEKE